MLDARGLSCPLPVVMVQKAVKKDHPEELEILLDTECSVENVSRYAANQGYTVTVETEGETSRLTLRKASGR